MKKMIIVFLLTALFALLVPSAINAQANIERLELELNRTDEIIEQAGELVRNSDNPVAVRVFNHATSLQEQAKRAFLDHRYIISFSLTTKAREKAYLAISIARQTDQLEGAVQRKLERAKELLDNIREMTSGFDLPELGELFHTAQVNLERAWEFYRGRQYRPALKLANQVLQAADRFLTVARQIEHGRLDFERKRENINRLLELAHDLIAECSVESAGQKLEHANQAISVADELFAKNRIRPSVQTLQRASSLIKSAMRDCNGWEHLEKIHNRLTNELSQLIDTMSDIENGDEHLLRSIRQLLELASDQLEIAADSMGNQQMESAQAALKGAELALNQAARQIKRIHN